ncbi:hypothetical protein BDZ91DRAFT_837613 [Kalaharituber pfeilii]|nr:hypothetical protein BDZ91DRAFT_837613 [Kalaharituber pfeilii]
MPGFQGRRRSPPPPYRRRPRAGENAFPPAYSRLPPTAPGQRRGRNRRRRAHDILPTSNGDTAQGLLMAAFRLVLVFSLLLTKQEQSGAGEEGPKATAQPLLYVEFLLHRRKKYTAYTIQDIYLLLVPSPPSNINANITQLTHHDAYAFRQTKICTTTLQCQAEAWRSVPIIGTDMEIMTAGIVEFVEGEVDKYHAVGTGATRQLALDPHTLKPSTRPQNCLQADGLNAYQLF